MKLRMAGLLALIGLAVSMSSPVAAAAVSYPAPSMTLGVWTNLTRSDRADDMWSFFVDANNSARLRTGDIVHGREAYVFLHPKTDGGVTYDAKLQDGEFDCKARSMRWIGLVEIDMTEKVNHLIRIKPQTEFTPVKASTAEAEALDFLCGDGDIHGRGAYFLLPQAHAALVLDQDSSHDQEPPPPAPHAAWDSDEPPAAGAWRVVDEKVDHAQLVDTSSLSWQGRTVRGWMAVSDNLVTGASPTTRVFTEARVELDCDGPKILITNVRDLGLSGQVLRTTKLPHSGDLGLFGKSDAGLGKTAVCHPQRVAGAPSFATPMAYRAQRPMKPASESKPAP